MAVIALCRALFLLFCRKLDIPSYAKPLKLDTSMVIIPCFCTLGIWGRSRFISFLVFHRKDLCEARVNFEVCSYFADIPTLADGPPPIEHGSLEDHYTE